MTLRRWAIIVACAGAAVADAQVAQLQFSSAPVQAKLATPSAAIVIERQALSTAPMPAATYLLTSTSAVGEFRNNPTATGGWAATYGVSFAVDAGTSAPVYFRDGRFGSGTLFIDGGVTALSASQAYAVAANGFADDFEAAAITAPTGRWNFQDTNAVGTVALDSTAKHRGNQGLLMVDPVDTATGGAVGSSANFFHALVAPDYFTRVWVRVDRALGPGQDIVLNAHAAGPTSQPIIDLHIRNPNGELALGGQDDTGANQTTLTGIFLADAGWHLVEMSATGLNSDAGTRTMWLDGQQVAQQVGISWQGVLMRRFNVGLPWTSDLRHDGQVALDDPRFSATPPASRLVVTPQVATAQLGQCVPLTVSLASSAGTVARAPFDMSVDIRASDGGAFFANAQCTQSVAQLALPDEALNATAYFSPATTGSFSFTADHPDMLAGAPSSALVVGSVGGGSGSAGGGSAANGGGGSAGGAAAGGGPTGEGSTGGTNGDAGVGANAANLGLTVGCDCHTTSFAWQSLAALALWHLRARRRPATGRRTE